MEQRTVEFKTFLKANSITITGLPEGIRDKIRHFDRLQDLHESIQESDLQELEEQIEQLDIEILEDIEEYYEDQLEHNESLDVDTLPKKIKKIATGKAVVKPVGDEAILEELVSMGRTKNLTRSKLIAMGLKTKVKRDVIIGQYILKRVSWFYHVYDIVSVQKK